MKKLIILLLIILSSLFVFACTTVDTVELTDVLRSPGNYVDKNVNISGTIKKSFASEQQGQEYLNVRIVDFQDYSMGVKCPGTTFNHNQRYIISGRIVLDNSTGEYYLVCN